MDVYGYEVEIIVEGYYEPQFSRKRDIITQAGHTWIRIKGCDSADDNIDLCNMISNGSWKKWRHETYEAVYDSNPSNSDSVSRKTPNKKNNYLAGYKPEFSSATRRLTAKEQADLARFLKQADENWNYFLDGTCTRFAMQAWKAAGGSTLTYQILGLSGRIVGGTVGNTVGRGVGGALGGIFGGPSGIVTGQIIGGGIGSFGGGLIGGLTPDIPTIGISSLNIEQKLQSKITDLRENTTQWIDHRRRDIENIANTAKRVGEAVNRIDELRQDWEDLQHRWSGLPWMS